ncbi:MAG: hypothetical protein KGO53_14255 [Alphaproteobacteria bacterium]|nr:hypothetical protein [Alphaproteobacteria bacterium]
MPKLSFAIALSCAALFGASAAGADSLQLTGKLRWLTLASSKDKDVAIGIARHESGRADVVKAVSSKNGYYAVIAGPYPANSIQDLKKADKGDRFADLPADALLSQGANYLETVWQSQKNGGIGLAPYALDKPAEFSGGALTVKVSAAKLGDDNAYTVVDGKDAQGTFHFDLGKDLPKEELASIDEFKSENFNQAAVVRLATGEGSPQVVITNYSGGAHCCTKTTFVIRDGASAAWTLIKTDALDGEGYWYEDVDGDGALELLSVDNSFLYAFDSYAGSFAPLKISKLRGGRLEDVTEEPAYHSRLVQDLAGMEYDAKLRPDDWKSNGFLAGWVASKIRLGQGDEAWARFMANYEKASDFGPQLCTTGAKVDDCPADKLAPVPIPKALAAHLKENGYTPLPKAAEAELR